MEPFAIKNSAERQLEQDTHSNRQQCLRPAFEDTEGQVTDQQNAGDEGGWNVSIVEADKRLPPGSRRHWRCGANWTIFALRASVFAFGASVRACWITFALHAPEFALGAA